MTRVCGNSLTASFVVSRKGDDILALKHEGECPEVVHGKVRPSFTHSARNSGNGQNPLG